MATNKTEQQDNLALYRGWAEVPANAQRRITGGKLNGKTDINPMWRIKMLTERFGPCGFGWYTQTLEHWIETAGGETCAWVRLLLFVKDPATGEWSKGIEGIGGNKQTGKGSGDGINDECFKSAETDGISVAAKKLGIGANVYWAADATKYTQPAPTPTVTPKVATPAPAPERDESITIDDIVESLAHAKSREDVIKIYRAYRQYYEGNQRFEAAVKEAGQRFPRPAAN